MKCLAGICTRVRGISAGTDGANTSLSQAGCHIFVVYNTINCNVINYMLKVFMECHLELSRMKQLNLCFCLSWQSMGNGFYFFFFPPD